jgi:hypothetical protein
MFTLHNISQEKNNEKTKKNLKNELNEKSDVFKF